MKLQKLVILGATTLVMLVSCNSAGNGKNGISSLSTQAQLTEREEALKVYSDFVDKMEANNFYAKCYGEVNAKIIIDYKQKIASNKIKTGNKVYFDTYATSTLVKEAEQRYENTETNRYGYLSGKNASNSGDSETGYVGSANFDGSFNIQTEEEYLETFGHSIRGLTNYSISKDNYDKTILNTGKSVADGYTTYTYQVSVTDSETTIDATKEYTVEMAHMSGMGKPTFTSAVFSLRFDSNNDMVEARIDETYRLKVLGLDSTLTSWMKIYVDFFNSIDDLSADLVSTYNTAIGKAEA